MHLRLKHNCLGFLVGSVLIAISLAALVVYNYPTLPQPDIDPILLANRFIAKWFSIYLLLFALADVLAYRSKWKYYVDAYRAGLYLFYCLVSAAFILSELKIDNPFSKYFSYVNFTVVIAILSVYIGLDSALDIVLSNNSKS